ncbi:MAG: tRNA (adenosine(37)-N6)-dimethylallyltransferase MiaA [Caulobacterales bacterium]|nr:tRNA (adenosine(37)-N6)-dimethylallyltransferase MiaA [Caulobacterales bacterium]
MAYAENMKGQILLIAGPTASGKSALALRAARAVDGEIVNADALQLYADLRVLSARPSEAEQAGVPHHLFGVADGADGWSVGRWLRAASPILADILARGRTPVMVGGTGLYFKALTEGLADVPPTPAAVRQSVTAMFDTLGEDRFRALLASADPDAARRIEAGDRMRLSRAMEVLEATGRPLSAWQADTAPALEPSAWRAAVILPDRAELYARCDARFDAMLAGGALEEVRALLTKGLNPNLPVMKAVGVRELERHLAGELTLEAAADLARQETRRYAKRQLTWLRNQTPDWPRITEIAPEAAWGQFLALETALTPSA